MALAEVADRSEVRRIERDNHHEIVPLAAGSSNAPRRIQPACIAMQQKRNHHARIERRLAEPTHIAAHDRLEIQALPHQPPGTFYRLLLPSTETVCSLAFVSRRLPFWHCVPTAPHHVPAAPPPPKKWSGQGRPPKLIRRDAKHRPISVKSLALGLPAKAWRTIRWREGSADWLSSRFARIRVRVAHRD